MYLGENTVIFQNKIFFWKKVKWKELKKCFLSLRPVHVFIGDDGSRLLLVSCVKTKKSTLIYLSPNHITFQNLIKGFCCQNRFCNMEAFTHCSCCFTFTFIQSKQCLVSIPLISTTVSVGHVSAHCMNGVLQNKLLCLQETNRFCLVLTQLTQVCHNKFVQGQYTQRPLY